MRRFLSGWIPEFRRVLLVESGARYISDRWSSHFRQRFGRHIQVDLVTCYSGLPEGLDATANIFRTTAYRTSESRRTLLRQLRRARYDVVAIMCTGEPILAKWKWLVAAAVPAKILVINENADYFWLDRTQWRVLKRLMSVRLGLTGSNVVSAFFRLLALPFGLMYLLLFAAAAHIRRRLYLRRRLTT